MANYTGSVIRDLPPYVASYDEKTHVWRILDTRHKSLEGLDLEDEVPDDSPAITLLPAGAWICLVQEAIEVGLIENAAVRQESQGKVDVLEEVNQELREENKRLRDDYNICKEKVETLTKKVEKPTRSDSFELKSKALDTILKLSIAEDVKAMNE